MIRFIRNLLITLVAIALILYGALWFIADDVKTRIKGPVEEELVDAFDPGENDEYRYKVRVDFMHLDVIISDFRMEAETMRVDGILFNDAELRIERIKCDLIPLLRDKTLDISEKDIREKSLEGLMSNAGIAEYLEEENDALSDIGVSEENGRCMIQGDLQPVQNLEVIIIGDWEIDDNNGSLILGNTEYIDWEGKSVDAAFAQGIAGEIDLVLSFTVFDEDMKIAAFEYTEEGLVIELEED